MFAVAVGSVTVTLGRALFKWDNPVNFNKDMKWGLLDEVPFRAT